MHDVLNRIEKHSRASQVRRYHFAQQAEPSCREDDVEVVDSGRNHIAVYVVRIVLGSSAALFSMPDEQSAPNWVPHTCNALWAANRLCRMQRACAPGG